MLFTIYPQKTCDSKVSGALTKFLQKVIQDLTGTWPWTDGSQEKETFLHHLGVILTIFCVQIFPKVNT